MLNGEVLDGQGVDKNAALADGVTVDENGTAHASMNDAGKSGDESLILGKFKTQADLEAAYKSLESKLGAPAKETVNLDISSEAPVEKGSTKKADASLDTLAAELLAEGSLSDKSSKALEKLGLTPDALNAYARGQKAIADERVAEFAKLAGGEEQLKATLEWAKANLSADELKSYTDAVKSGNQAAAKLAFRGIMAAYNEAEPSEPNFISGSEGGRRADTVQAFGTTEEMVRAINDKRYNVEAAYTAAVHARIAKSSFASAAIY